jgi:hypothetical protein
MCGKTKRTKIEKKKRKTPGTKSSNIESTGKLWPDNVATSSAVPGRRIGRADGPDEASFGHFVKNSSIFNEINPQSGLSSQTFFVKKSKTFPKPTCSPTSTVLGKFPKKPFSFNKINPPSWSFLRIS